LSRGADVNKPNLDGDTALMYAAVRGDPEVVKLLLSHGAAVNARNRAGETALRQAVDAHLAPIAAILQRAGGVK